MSETDVLLLQVSAEVHVDRGADRPRLRDDPVRALLAVHQEHGVRQEIEDGQVVEHDLAVLDFLADTVFLMYGEEGAYGIIAQPRPVRTAINVYLGGYLKEENIRFRHRELRLDRQS